MKKNLPGLIVFPAMMALASAAVINPDGFGNVLVTTTDSGANNIVIPPGQPAGPHEIRFDPNTFLTPSGAASIDIQVVDGAGASYTVNMGAGSSISGGANDGITTANTAGTAEDLLINASGSIIGANGISGGPGLITVVNDADITGTAGAGINSTGTVNLTNNFFQPTDIASLVTGSTSGVVATGDGSTISNFGTITGGGANGVQVGNDGTVSNLTTIDSDFPFNGAIFGGRITGGTNGILAGDDLTFLNQNLGDVSGLSGDGINAGTGASITNNAGASISGSVNGVITGTEALIVNSGTITSGTGDGIRAAGGNNTSITNTGTIEGGVDGIQITNTASGDVVNNSGTIDANTNGVEFFAGGGAVLNNSGTITGGTRSFFGSEGNDTLNLNLGSRLIGNVSTISGDDIINFNGGLSSPSSAGNSISGDIRGVETVNKTGGGVALIGLPGEALFDIEVDTFNIAAGGLYLNGDVSGSAGALSTINAGGAAVGGTGEWNADVFITGAGGISPGAIPINLDANPLNAVGQVTITGDVDHAPGTFIRFDVAPQGGARDLLLQTGAGNTYDMTGANIRISATDNNRVISNGTYTVIDSQEVITGVGTGALQIQFNPNVNSADTSVQGSEIFNANPVGTTVLTNFFTTVGTQDGGTNLVLTVNHDFANLPGLDANEAALGAALDASINTPNAITQDFIAALDYSSLGAVQATLASVIPDNVLASASALVSDNYRVHRLVQDHLAMTRSGGTVIETPAMTDAKGGMIPATTTMGSSRGNVWGTFSYDWRDSDFRNPDIEGETGAFTAGFDYRVAPEFLVGILLDGSQSDYDYLGGSSEIESFRAAIYGTYGQSTGLYADFLVGYGNHDLDLDRNLAGILAGSSYNASTDADSFQALITVGYAMESGNIKHGPFAGLEYQNIDVDGFAPTGVATTIGGVGDFEVDSLRLLVGYRAETTYGKFSPYASVTYAHEFEDGPISATATIPGGATFGFTGGGVESAILISLGTGYAINQNLVLNAGYHGEISTGDGVDSHGLALGLNYSF